MVKRCVSLKKIIIVIMYNMSSGLEELTQIRKITAEDYVIWMKMNDLQENLDPWTLCLENKTK